MPKVPRSWDGSRWSLPVGDFLSVPATLFQPRYLGADTVFQRSVADMPLAEKSADYAAWLAEHINYGEGFGPTSVNTSAFGTFPIQVHIVDSRRGDTNRAYVTGNFPGGEYGYAAALLQGEIPWPHYDVEVQEGQDSGLCIVDIGTGVIREYYLVQRVEGHANRWTALTGGYSLSKPDLVDFAARNYSTQFIEGGNSVVHMHNWLGFVGISEALQGTVDHALAFTFSNCAIPTTPAETIRADGTRYTAVGPSWPAKGGDGDTPGDVAPIHGQWGRLPISLDPSPYKPFTRLLIKAAQTYGIVGTDTNNFVHAFNVEHGGPWKSMFGSDPWHAGGVVRTKYEELCLLEGRPAKDAISASDFPWHLTEWAPRSWGKPE